MRLSRERLRREATTTGFRVEILEKVAHLLDLLDGINRHPSTPAFPVLDIHELAAGKLAALLARRASRDLFDAHHLLLRGGLDASSCASRSWSTAR